ncbi:MAG TPA: GNAT family N-acetyltransferase [Pyrinomonadaceae bacterium]
MKDRMMAGSNFSVENLGSREVTDDDYTFLMELFASTRSVELAMFSNEEQKRAFVSMQFSALMRCYPKAHSTIILYGQVPIGRTIIDRNSEELRLVDISLLPEYRNRGIGAFLVRQLLDESRESKIPVRLHVFKYGDAVRFYERLGFQLLEDDGSYLKMEFQS